MARPEAAGHAEGGADGGEDRLNVKDQGIGNRAAGIGDSEDVLTG